MARSMRIFLYSKSFSYSINIDGIGATWINVISNIHKPSAVANNKGAVPS